MSTRLMVLGVIQREKQAHGYKVYRELASWQAEYWAGIRPGSVYHALEQMAKEGLLQVKKANSSRKGSDSTIYILTAKGNRKLIELIEKSLLEHDQKSFAAGLAFMCELPRVRVIELIRQRLFSYKQLRDFLYKLPTDPNSSDPSKHPEIINSWATIYTATAGWMEQYIKRLEQGQYTFADERPEPRSHVAEETVQHTNSSLSS